MFAKMKKVLVSLKKTQRTNIDNRMLCVAERFVREDFLIIYYSQKSLPHYVPEPLVLDSIAGDRIDQLKSLVTEL